MRIKECEPVVEEAMEIWPLAQDSNEALISGVYKLILGDKLKGMNFYEGLEYIYTHKVTENLPAITSIIRNRSVVQNRRENLRGNNYNKNRRNREIIKEDLGYGK